MLFVSAPHVLPRARAHRVPQLSSRLEKQRDGGVCSTICLNRLLFTSSEVREQKVKLPFTDVRASHFRDVLRVNAERRVRAGVLGEALYDDVPVFVDTDEVWFSLGEATAKALPNPPPVSLLLAMPRPKVLARLLPQIASIGIQHLVLLNAYRVERCYFDAAILRDPRAVNHALVQGLMQAGNDARMPNVRVERRLRVFLEDSLHMVAPPDSLRIVAHPGNAPSIMHRLVDRGNSKTSAPRVVVAVGPEGGWMPREISMLQEFGFQTVSLGNRVLRTDAAVLILLGLIQECQRYCSIQKNEIT